MKRSIVATILMLAVAGTIALAHGNEVHVLGTVKVITAKAITVETIQKQTKVVPFTPHTTFFNGTEPAAPSDLKVGDRVVIHADVHDGRLRATEVKFSTARQGKTR